MRVAINGLGRIGRLVLRHLVETNGMDVVAVNDIAPLDNLAYLLRHDSVHPAPAVSVEAGEGVLRWGEREITATRIGNVDELPWRTLEVDLVVESSGAFTKKGQAARHLDAGAGRVVVSAPAEGVDLTVCLGVNEDRLDPREHRVVSMASCTTNCLAPVAKVLHEEFGLETGFLTTVHAVTASQTVVDGASRKWRRGRSALCSIIPTTTGAAKATTLVLPELEGRLDGMAMRVPVANGSVIDLVARTERPVDAEKANDAFRRAAGAKRLRGILGVTDEELVSADIVGTTYSALVDAPSTMALGDRTVKVVAWYDNEWAYARRIADLAALVAREG